MTHFRTTNELLSDSFSLAFEKNTCTIKTMSVRNNILSTVYIDLVWNLKYIAPSVCAECACFYVLIQASLTWVKGQCRFVVKLNLVAKSPNGSTTGNTTHTATLSTLIQNRIILGKQHIF